MTDQDSTFSAIDTAAGIKEYIYGFITTLKLTEKEIRSLEDETVKWESRIELARSRGAGGLLAQAEKEAERIKVKLTALREEERILRERIAAMRRQLPQQLLSLAARERNIDADLLEQELLMALGHTEEEAGADRAFSKLEKDNAAEEALEKLKLKMKGNDP